VWQAGLGGEHVGGEAGGGDQRRPPDQAAGPAGQLGGATTPVGGQGGAARAAQAAGDRLGRNRRLGSAGLTLSPQRGPGDPEGVPRSVEKGPAAAQQLGGLAGVGVQEPLELLGGQSTNRQAAAPVDRRAERLRVVLILVGGPGAGACWAPFCQQG
jgi:hypothetical protein